MTRTAALAALLLAACATRPPLPDSPAGPPLVRCYAVRYADRGLASVFPARLDFAGEDPEVWGEPAPGGRRLWEMFGPGMRQAVRGDSVRVVFSNGFSGIVLTFTQSADSLSGNAYVEYDVVGPTPPPRIPLAGSRVACPSSREAAGSR